MKSLTELEQGQSLEEVTLEPVTRLDLIKYAGASGDFNPIHTIDEEAAKAGLPGIIAHGMWTMGNLAKLFTPYYEEEFIQDYTVRFTGMVFLNDVLTLRTEVEEKSEQSIVFNVSAINQNGKTVIKGKVKFRLYG